MIRRHSKRTVNFWTDCCVTVERSFVVNVPTWPLARAFYTWSATAAMQTHYIYPALRWYVGNSASIFAHA